MEVGLAQTNKRRKTTTEPAWQRGGTMCTELLGDLSDMSG